MVTAQGLWLVQFRQAIPEKGLHIHEKLVLANKWKHSYALIILKLDSCIKFESIFLSFMLKLGPYAIQKHIVLLRKESSTVKA